METLDFIFNYVLDQTVQVSALVMLMACLTFVLRHRSAHVRYLLWLVVLAKCLVPPVMSVSVPQIQVPARAVVTQVTADEVTEPVVVPVDLANPAEVPVEATIASEAPIHWNWGLVWLLGGGTFLLLALGKASYLEFRLRRQRRALSLQQHAMVHQLSQELGDAKLPSLWQIDNLLQPFVWGLPRGAIYVPADLWTQRCESHVRCALAHELMHVRRWDAAVNVLQILAQAIFWFHPLVWWTNHRLRHERERCCDEAAIALLNTPSEVYGEAIIETLASARQGLRLQSSLAIAGPLRGIEKRLKSIMKANKRFEHKPNWATILGVGLMGLTLIPITWQPLLAETGAMDAPLDSPEKEQPNAIKYTANIYEVDKDVLQSDGKFLACVNDALAQRLKKMAEQDDKVSLISRPTAEVINGESAIFSLIHSETFWKGWEEQGEDDKTLSHANVGVTMTVTGHIVRNGSSIDLTIKVDTKDLIVPEEINEQDQPLVVSNGVEARILVQWQQAVVISGLDKPGNPEKYTVIVWDLHPSNAPTLGQVSLAQNVSMPSEAYGVVSTPMVSADRFLNHTDFIKRTEFIQNDAMVKALVTKQIELEMKLMDFDEELAPDHPEVQAIQRKLDNIVQRLEEQKERVGHAFDQACEAEQTYK